jgi:sugar/nucleoside kinase (ribokinase family)
MRNIGQILKKFDIAVVGEINPDLILTGDVAPAFGQVEKMVADATLTIGSSACIFACGAARLGLKVSFIGKVGDDEFGHFMREQLIRREVDVRGLVVDSQLKTGLSVILSHGSDRAILTYAGTIPELRYDEIDLGILAQARHLHIGSYYLLKHLRPQIPTLFARARELGLTISLDTNYDPSERWDGVQDILDLIDVFLPNETEITAVAGGEGVEASLRRLARRELIVAAKLGAQGGAVLLQNRLVSTPALPVQVVDTTGAGDSFDAGFLYGYLNGWDPERSLALACICGSLSTRKAGGTSAQPTLDEAAGYLDQNQF